MYSDPFDIATYTDPKAVPRIVWGLKNLQQASLNAEILVTRGSDPAAPTWVQAWQHPLYNINGMDRYSLSRFFYYWVGQRRRLKYAGIKRTAVTVRMVKRKGKRGTSLAVECPWVQ